MALAPRREEEDDGARETACVPLDRELPERDTTPLEPELLPDGADDGRVERALSCGDASSGAATVASTAPASRIELRLSFVLMAVLLQ